METILTTAEVIDEIALCFLERNWEVDHQIFNMNVLGWTFKFNNAKIALGTCDFRRKTIYISKYLLDDNMEVDIWEDTIKHEIAHAIDFERRGDSDHGPIWKSIALQVGCSPNRTHKGEQLNVGKSKYTLKCNNCGFEKPIHRKRKRNIACTPCCVEHNAGNYTNKFELNLIINY